MASDQSGDGLMQRLDLEDDDRLDRSIEAGDFDDPAAFVREATLRLIDDVLDEDGELECPHDDCGRTFATVRERRGHLGSSEHGLDVPGGEFWCGYCGYGPTSWRGINGHHGKLHDGDPVRLDHEPGRDELLAPEDVPDHMNAALLERLYQEYGGNYTEMCRQHDFDVGAGRVRHYLIEFGIHEVMPNGETDDGDGPVWRDREWLKERYEAADGNISEMHRNLDEDIPYRTLVNNIKRFDFHDHTDPPGQSHGKGGPEAETIDDGEDVDAGDEGDDHPPIETDNGDPSVNQEADAGDEGALAGADSGDEPQGSDAEDPPATPSKPADSAESVSAEAVDVDADEEVYVLEWGRWGPPLSGTYHESEDCWVLSRSDSDREVVPLPWPRSEVEADDDWEVCGHCEDVDAGDEGDDHPPIETDNGDPSVNQEADAGDEGALAGAEGHAGWVLDAEPVFQMLSFEALGTPDWMGELTFYEGVDMADDMQDLSEILGWEGDGYLEQMVEALPDVDVPGELEP